MGLPVGLAWRSPLNLLRAQAPKLGASPCRKKGQSDHSNLSGAPGWVGGLVKGCSSTVAVVEAAACREELLERSTAISTRLMAVGYRGK